jgi:hypothetical protein
MKVQDSVLCKECGGLGPDDFYSVALSKQEKENASLRAETAMLKDMLKPMSDELGEIRDPDSVSLGEAVDVLLNATADGNFKTWTALRDDKKWSVTVKSEEEGALTPQQYIEQMEDALEVATDTCNTHVEENELLKLALETVSNRLRDAAGIGSQRND